MCGRKPFHEVLFFLLLCLVVSYLVTKQIRLISLESKVHLDQLLWVAVRVYLAEALVSLNLHCEEGV